MAMKKIRTCIALAMLCCVGNAALAQTTPAVPSAAPPASPPAEDPGWAKGRPAKNEAAMKMAPVPAFPIPTAPDKLPTAKFKLPPGFKVETWASGVLDARELRQGDKGNIFVSSLFVANKVYVIPEKGEHKAKVLIDNMPMATGIAFHSSRCASRYRAPASPCPTAWSDAAAF